MPYLAYLAFGGTSNRPYWTLDIAETTIKAMVNLQKEKHKVILMVMQHFRTTCAVSMRLSLQLSSTFLPDVGFLCPLERSLNESERCINRIAWELHELVNDDNLTSVLDEWKPMFWPFGGPNPFTGTAKRDTLYVIDGGRLLQTVAIVIEKARSPIVLLFDLVMCRYHVDAVL